MGRSSLVFDRDHKDTNASLKSCVTRNYRYHWAECRDSHKLLCCLGELSEKQKAELQQEVEKLASENASMKMELDALRSKYEALQNFARTVARSPVTPVRGPLTSSMGPLVPGKVATTSVITIVKSKTDARS